MPHKHGLAAAASAAIAAIALGGCGGSSFGGGGHPGTTPPDGCSASTSSTAVGAICQARQVAAVAPAGGTPTNSIGNGTPLYKNEAITTGSGAGHVDFWIDTEITNCEAYDGSPPGGTPDTAKLTVWPPLTFGGHQILVDYEHGYVTCDTTKHGQGIVLGVMGKIYITTNDPVWTVEVDNDGTIKIRVYAGVVNVGKDAQHLQQVTANEEIVIGPDGTIETPHAFKPEAMSRTEQDAVAFVQH